MSVVERHTTQRTKLLDAATAVIATRGFLDTTVETIVARAGMSRRTFYEHFNDVRDVLAQIYERATTISMTMVTSSARAHADPVEALRAALAAYFAAVTSQPDVACVMFQEYRLGGRDFEARYQRDSQRYAELLRELLASAHATGKLAKAPNEATVFALAKGIEALAVRAVAEQKHSRLNELIPELLHALLAPLR